MIIPYGVPAFIIFFAGLVIGSFLNVCIYRMPKNESIVMPSSRCPKCKSCIQWYDNVPVLSFLILGGKCRACKAKISLRYPIVEVLTAISMAALFLKFGITPKFFAYSIMACGLIVATFVDFEIQEIPDEISIGGTVLGIIMVAIFPSILNEATRVHGLISSVAGAAAGGGSIYILGTLGSIAFRKEAMGGGDVKLMAMIGSIIGWKLVIFTFFFAPFFAVVPGLIAKYRDGAEIIPYGPFLSLASMITIFFGNDILHFIFRGLF